MKFKQNAEKSSSTVILDKTKMFTFKCKLSTGTKFKTVWTIVIAFVTTQIISLCDHTTSTTPNKASLFLSSNQHHVGASTDGRPSIFAAALAGSAPALNHRHSSNSRLTNGNSNYRPLVTSNSIHHQHHTLVATSSLLPSSFASNSDVKSQSLNTNNNPSQAQSHQFQMEGLNSPIAMYHHQQQESPSQHHQHYQLAHTHYSSQPMSSMNSQLHPSSATSAESQTNPSNYFDTNIMEGKSQSDLSAASSSSSSSSSNSNSSPGGNGDFNNNGQGHDSSITTNSDVEQDQFQSARERCRELISLTLLSFKDLSSNERASEEIDCANLREQIAAASGRSSSQSQKNSQNTNYNRQQQQTLKEQAQTVQPPLANSQADQLDLGASNASSGPLSFGSEFQDGYEESGPSSGGAIQPAEELPLVQTAPEQAQDQRQILALNTNQASAAQNNFPLVRQASRNSQSNQPQPQLQQPKRQPQLAASSFALTSPSPSLLSSSPLSPTSPSTQLASLTPMTATVSSTLSSANNGNNNNQLLTAAPSTRWDGPKNYINQIQQLLLDQQQQQQSHRQQERDNMLQFYQQLAAAHKQHFQQQQVQQQSPSAELPQTAMSSSTSGIAASGTATTTQSNLPQTTLATTFESLLETTTLPDLQQLMMTTTQSNPTPTTTKATATTTSTTTTTTTTTTTPKPNQPKIRVGAPPGVRRPKARHRTSTTTTTTTTTQKPSTMADYADGSEVSTDYYDEYDDQQPTTTTTTTQRPRGRKGKRKFTSTTPKPTTTTTLSPGYQPRPDGRIIDYMADPNFPRELKGADLTNYPFYISVPDKIDFDCKGRHDGYYSNINLHCQIYHHCAIGQRYDFLCPNYTLFDQTTFTCRFINTVDCDGSTKHYDRNNALYVEKDDSNNNNNYNNNNSNNNNNNNRKQDQSSSSPSIPSSTTTTTSTTTTQAPKLNIQMTRRFGQLIDRTDKSTSISALALVTRMSNKNNDSSGTPKSDTTIK